MVGVWAIDQPVTACCADRYLILSRDSGETHPLLYFSVNDVDGVFGRLTRGRKDAPVLTIFAERNLVNQSHGSLGGLWANQKCLL
jgi:hypothetical protein